MRDPLSWSVPAGSWLGIRIRIHLSLLLFLLYQLFHYSGDRAAGLGVGLAVGAILFLSVLLHEFGHCFAARAVGGDADEILMWPLGGLAYVTAPNTPRDQFITAVCGPLVNVAICALCGVVLLVSGSIPPVNPLQPLSGYGREPVLLSWVSVVFGLNWVLLLFNLIPAFPLDGGRMLRCLLWGRLGFGRATMLSVQTAKICAIAFFFFALLLPTFIPEIGQTNLLLLCVAVFIYFSAEMERRMLEEGMLFDDSVFGYDFSQGHTSLGRSSEAPRRRRVSFWEQWRQRRARLRAQREQQSQAEQAQRVDEILAKLHRHGMASLTEQERRFLSRISAQYRNRNRLTD